MRVPAIATASVVLVSAVLAFAGPVWSAAGEDAVASPTGSGRADGVPLDAAYQFDAEGLVSLTDVSRLPAARGSVNAQWYELDGWVALVFEGLDLTTSGPLCLGTSTIDPVSGLLAHATFDATENGACDASGAGPVPLATGDTGLRVCTDAIVYITRIPVETGGPLIANIVAFDGDGNGVGLSGRLETPTLERPLDPALVDCGPRPPGRQPVPATPIPDPTPPVTPAPYQAGTVAASQRAPAPTPRPQDACPPPSGSGLLDMHRSAVGPYLLHQPAIADPNVPTIVFLPGGGGRFGTAQRAWDTFFSGGAGFEEFRVVIPYSVDGVLLDEALRTFAILDEVLWCQGGDPMQVHLAGSSNGGLAAFGLMSRQPERFATLLGAPGAFPVQDPISVEPGVWLELFAGRAVFNGVGEFDADWRPEVLATHNVLTEAGVESFFADLPRQGHVPGSDFDSSILLEFWDSHP